MDLIRKIIFIWNCLSLDVAAGSLGGGILATKSLGIAMPWAWYFLLPAGTWLVYTADHSLDAIRLKGLAHTARHIFHYNNIKWIAALFATVFGLSTWIAFKYLPSEMIKMGAAIAFFSAIHLAFVKLAGKSVSPLLFKEAGVAFGYCCGVLVFPWMIAGYHTEPQNFLAFAEFMMIALINLLIFSLYEAETDKLDGHTSFVLAIGKKGAVIIIAFLVLGISIISSVSLVVPEFYLLRTVQSPWIMITAVHAVILFNPSYFGINLRYRIWGDGIFAIQFLSLLY